MQGALALCLYAGALVDEARSASDESDRADAELLLDVLTPVVKSWPSEWCLEANKWAIQVCVGAGCVCV